MKKIQFFIMLGLIISGLQACGQVGPLYHPDEEAPIYVPKDES